MLASAADKQAALAAFLAGPLSVGPGPSRSKASAAAAAAAAAAALAPAHQALGLPAHAAAGPQAPRFVDPHYSYDVDDPCGRLRAIIQSMAPDIAVLPQLEAAAALAARARSHLEANARRVVYKVPEIDELETKVTLSLPEELILVYMHSTRTAWSAVAAALPPYTAPQLEQLWQRLSCCAARGGPLLDTYIAAVVRGWARAGAYALAVKALPSAERRRTLRDATPQQQPLVRAALALAGSTGDLVERAVAAAAPVPAEAAAATSSSTWSERQLQQRAQLQALLAGAPVAPGAKCLAAVAARATSTEHPSAHAVAAELGSARSPGAATAAPNTNARPRVAAAAGTGSKGAAAGAAAAQAAKPAALRGPGITPQMQAVVAELAQRRHAADGGVGAAVTPQSASDSAATAPAAAAAAGSNGSKKLRFKLGGQPSQQPSQLQRAGLPDAAGKQAAAAAAAAGVQAAGGTAAADTTAVEHKQQQQPGIHRQQQQQQPDQRQQPDQHTHAGLSAAALSVLQQLEALQHSAPALVGEVLQAASSAPTRHAPEKRRPTCADAAPFAEAGAAAGSGSDGGQAAKRQRK